MLSGQLGRDRVMNEADSTCWTVLRAAAEGDAPARAEFAARYAPLVRAYFAARWRNAALAQDLDDAVQEVFVACLQEGGLLERAERGRSGGFRAYFYGLARNVARRIEEQRARRPDSPVARLEAVDDEASLSRAFDRAWAQSVMREAAARQAACAEQAGGAARRRVELLRLRFQEDLPIREIARLWSADAAELHHEYARARKEFKAALLAVLAFYHPDAPAAAEREAAELLALLA